MAEKRRQEEADENSFSKRHCVENVDVVGDLNGEEGPVDQEVVEGPPASWGSQASSSDSSGSSSSGHQAGGDSSSEGSIADSLDLGLGDIQPDTLAGPMGWLQKQMMSGINPRSILMRIIPPGMIIPEEMDEFEMWSIIAEYLRSIDEPPPRQKLEQYNTFDDALQLLRSCKNILVLTGAGVSVSCGIPDFRSRDGVYARLAVDFPDLPDPQAMFEISYFRKDPRPFYKFAKELFPGQFKPSTSHKFISQLEQHQKLLRNYTQNIDTLEQAAGITRVIQCHGSFATATCTRCGLRVDSDAIREDVFNQVVPICPHCGPDTPEMAVLKPDIVFFGEGLPNNFYDKLNDDKEAADLLIVMGSSLKVRPVATIPSLLPKNVPQILINREPLHHLNFDIELLGDCDVIINEILHRLGEGWNHACQSQQRLTETTDIPDIPRPAKEIHKEKKAVLDEGETTEDCKTDAASVVSMSNPEKIDVKSEKVLQKSLSELKESRGDDLDDRCEASIRGEDDDRLASSDSKESFMMEGDKNQSCNERHQPQIEKARSEPCINGSTFEGKLHVDAPPSSGSKANDPSSPVSDRLQSSDVKFDSALVSSEPQTSITTPSESTRAPTVQSANAAESYMHFQRTLDSIGNSSMSSSSSGVKVEKDHTLERDPESCKTHVDSDSKQLSVGVKSESLEMSVTEGDRTNSPEDLEDKSSAVVNVGSPEATDHKEQASPAQGAETKLSPSTSAAAKTSRETVATYLKESTYLFIPPMRYVFHGAEVYLSDDESEHGLEGLDNDTDVNDLHNDTEDGDLNRDLHGDLHDDLHDDLHNADDLPDLLNLDHSSAKEKNVSLDDLMPTVPLTGRESSQYVQPVSKAQYDLESNGREGSHFEAPAHESVYHTNMEQPVTP